MIKATTLSFGVILLLLMTGPVSAQINADRAAKMAEEEALRRQETLELLNKNLDKAQAAQKHNDNEGAAVLYEQCLRQVRLLGGVGVEVQNKAALAGLVAVRLKIAYDFQDKSKYQGAADQAEMILKFDPQNKQAA